MAEPEYELDGREQDPENVDTDALSDEYTVDESKMVKW